MRLFVWGSLECGQAATVDKIAALLGADLSSHSRNFFGRLNTMAAVTKGRGHSKVKVAYIVKQYQVQRDTHSLTPHILPCTHTHTRAGKEETGFPVWVVEQQREVLPWRFPQHLVVEFTPIVVVVCMCVSRDE